MNTRRGAIEAINTLRRRAFGIVATRVGLTGDDAKEFLHQTAGVKSLTQLSLHGWRGLVGVLEKRTPTEVMQAPKGCTPAQWRKLMVLKKALKYSDAKFRAEIQRIAKVDYENWLDVPKARIVIAGLERTYEHRQAKAAKPAKPRQRPKRLPGEEWYALRDHWAHAGGR